MEISGVQMDLEHAIQAVRFMTGDRDGGVAVAVFVQNIQDGLRIRKYRFPEFMYIGMRMKIRRNGFARGEIENEVIGSGESV